MIGVTRQSAPLLLRSVVLLDKEPTEKQLEAAYQKAEKALLKVRK